VMRVPRARALITVEIRDMGASPWCMVSFVVVVFVVFFIIIIGMDFPAE
jgi:hypothetical protein